MSEAKHTPAPWFVIESLHDSGITYHISNHKNQMQGIRVCQTQNRENAHLIASAPELLEALEGVLSYEGELDDCAPPSEYGKELYNKARKAIAKAGRA